MRYERGEQRRDYRNGHYARSLDTSIGHIDNLPVPRTRGGYQTQVFERYHRRRTELDQTIGEMFIDGGEHDARGRGGRNLDGDQAQRLDGLTRVSHAGKRI